MERKGYIAGINGPVVIVRGSEEFQMLEMVLVGNEKLMGEVIRINNGDKIVQVYESTTGLKINEPVFSRNEPMSLMLGPGIIGGIFDGIQRPLKDIFESSGTFIGKGVYTESLNVTKEWDVKILVAEGDCIEGGHIYASVKETELIDHKIMLKPGVSGVVKVVKPDGKYCVNDCIVIIEDQYGDEVELPLWQAWPVRKPRPFLNRRRLIKPLITGQRVIDTLFPIAKGGSAAVPGGFGAGKTMTQHQLAKWCDADIIVYIGCGERGNEITAVLEDFPKLIDPKSGKPLMERTVLIANTSNMPVAAREASIYTGITIAEYYRDMGYHVAIMADSTSRWAEALREISGRLEEMPAEEGFPSYLPSRLSQFYERAGYVDNLNQTEGSVSIIGTVSPQGGDFSEPVTQNTKRFVRCFWALDKSLAYARHYPAIDWLTSYSEYMIDLGDWYTEHVGRQFHEVRRRMVALLQEESKLMEIVKLVGADILPEEQKLILEIAKLFRVGFLQQNAFHDLDTFTPIEKQFVMMNVILYTNDEATKLIESGIPVSQIHNTGIMDEVIKMKYDYDNENLEQFEALYETINTKFGELKESYKNFERK